MKKYIERFNRTLKTVIIIVFIINVNVNAKSSLKDFENSAVTSFFTPTKYFSVVPTDITISNLSVQESKSFVGSLTTTDATPAPSYTYTLVSGTGDEDNGSFTIVDNKLYFSVAPDFEAPTDTDTNNTYSIRIRTNDGTNTFEKNFIITVNDVNPEIDTDSDGLLDLVDLDDDNDGILDINEASLSNSINYEFYNASPSGYTVDNIPTVGATSTGAVSSFDVDALHTQITPGDPDTFSVRFTGFINITTSGNYTFYTTSDDGSKLLINGTEVVDNDGLHGNRTVSGTITLPVGLHQITVLFFENGGGEGLTVEYEGPSIIRDEVPFSVLTNIVGGDIDNDGIINSLDIDSDGDGCPDALEASGTVTSGDLDVNNRIIGSINDEGVPILATAGAGSGQGIGASQNNTVITSCIDSDGDLIADNLDLDDDNDGILDADEGDADIDGDTIPNRLDLDSDGDSCPDAIEGSGTFTEDNLNPNSSALNSSIDTNGIPTIVPAGQGIGDSQNNTLNNSCADSDGDLIIDFLDLDDDNDGILDSNENVMSNSLYYEFYDATPAGNSVDNIPSTGATATGIATSFDVNKIQQDITPSDDETYSIRFTGLINISTTEAYTFSLTSDDGSKLIIDGEVVVNHDGLHSNSTRTGSINLTSGLHELTVLYFENTANSSLSISYQSVSIPLQQVPFSILTNKLGGDIDGDGTVNRHDLDSDGDGCPDAIEGGGIANEDDLDSNFRLDSSVNSDGIPIHINAGSGTGQAIGSSQNSVIFSCTDSDGDSIVDLVDLDDDNDGILDADEGTSDLDGDGIPNHLDLDSDGDGCPDAIEGGGAIVESNLKINNSIIGSVNTSGVPNLIGAGGQTVGESQNASLKSSCVDTDGDTIMDALDLDDDNDGILDTEENLPEGSIGLLNYEFYDSTPAASSANNIPTTGATGTGTVSNFDVSDLQNIVTPVDISNYSIRYTGFINITIADNYTFYTTSDDGSKLYIDDVEIVDNDGYHSSRTRNGTKFLDVGLHKFTVLFFQGTGSATLDVEYSGPGIAKQSIPFSTLTNTLTTDSDGDSIPNQLDTDSDGDGCPDALEASGSVIAANLDINNRITGATNANGVPMLIAAGGGNGQPAGNSLDNTINSCNDSDGDGIADGSDLDDDNDGITDANEGSIDEDGDGVPNNLDLDSDGDGCPDAIEGTGSFTKYNLSEDNRLTGSVDANGIPTIVGPGQLVGDSQISGVQPASCSTGDAMITQVYQTSSFKVIEVTNTGSVSIPANSIVLALFKDATSAVGIAPTNTFTISTTLNAGASVLISSASLPDSINTAVSESVNANITDVSNQNDILILTKTTSTNAWEDRYDVVKDIPNETSLVRTDSTRDVNKQYDESEWIEFIDENITIFSNPVDNANERHAHACIISEIKNANTEANVCLGRHRINSTSRIGASWSNGVPDKSRNVIIDQDYEHTGSELSANNLIVNATRKLTITDNVLVVTNNIILNGEIRLASDAQLIQTHTGNSQISGTGKLLVDQNSPTASKFRYNYLISPVNSIGLTTYKVEDVLKDGTNPVSASGIIDNSATGIARDINFVTGYNGDTTTPISISEFWLYGFPSGSSERGSWVKRGKTGTIPQTDGFLLKGPGIAQNYTFVGTPKGGDLITNIGVSHNYLVGNPYPSALSAKKFLEDNISSTRGTLYFWQHASEKNDTGNQGHYYSGYIGGYATRNIATGTAAVNLVDAGFTAKEPKDFIAIGQAFFVSGSLTGGPIVFNNSQREYIKEGANSVFFKSNNSKKKKGTKLPIIKLGMNFKGKNNLSYHRQIAVSFKEKKSFDYDNGYDSELFDLGETDFYWKFNEQSKYVIAGVQNISEDMELPLEIVVNYSGNIEIQIDELTNFSENIFLKDNETNTYYNLRNKQAIINLKKGTYADRFYLVFMQKEVLNTSDSNTLLNSHIEIYNNRTLKELTIDNTKGIQINKVEIFTMLGQKIQEWDDLGNAIKQKLTTDKVSTGMYIIRVQTEKGVISKKMLLQ